MASGMAELTALHNAALPAPAARNRIAVRRCTRPMRVVACVQGGGRDGKGGASRGQQPAFNGVRGVWAGAIGGVAAGFTPSAAHAEGLRMTPLVGGSDRGRRLAGGKDDGAKRVLIMMSDTGGGHRASAEALKGAFEMTYGGKFKILIVDMWKHHCRWPVNRFGDSYGFMVKHPWIWRLQFRSSEPRFIHRPLLGATYQYVKKNIGNALDQYKPHLIVSVHPLLQHVVLNVVRNRVKRGLQAPVPFATVVTDLTKCHPTWYHKDVTACFVPTDVCRQQALDLGLKDSQIVVHGLPIRPQFSQRLPRKEVLRKKLGMLQSAPTVMMAGGGEGMGNLEATLKAMVGKLSPDAQVVVICGRNAKLAKKLASQTYPFKVIVNGFVNNMSEWMAASDCLVTKAGPGTIAEALIRGVPLLLNGCVPCQEEGNIPFVVDNNVGKFCTKPNGIAEIVASWLGPDKAELAAMAVRAKALGRPNATFRIVEDLAALAEQQFNRVRFVAPGTPKLLTAPARR